MIDLVTIILSLTALWFLYDAPFPFNLLAVLFVVTFTFALFHLLKPKRKEYILRIGRFRWTLEDFCRGWLITGKTGCGKTASGILWMLFQLCTHVPTWGGMTLDDKGLFYKVLVKMFDHFHRTNELRLIQVRPDNANTTWQPRDTWNPLADKTMPYSAHAKIICDVAASFSSNSQSFFVQQAQIAMEYAMRALDCTEHDVTLVNVYEAATNEDDLKLLLASLEQLIAERGPKYKEASEIHDFFTKRFLTLPPETLGGLRAEVVRYLKPFTNESLRQIFSPTVSTVCMADMDQGHVLCIAIPQKFATERLYLNTMAKFYFYFHALRRFDDADALSKKNLIVLVSDENQNIVTASEEGMSDYKIVDRIREAKATVVAATQSPTSYFPAFKAKDKAMTYMNNLTNRLIYTAADKEGAEISANMLPPKKVWEYTYSTGKGGGGSNRKQIWKLPFEPGQFFGLRKFHCVVQHCEKGHSKILLPPITPEGNVPDWYKGRKRQVEKEESKARAEDIPEMAAKIQVS